MNLWTWITIGVLAYLAVGLGFLIRGSMRDGPPEGETVLKIILVWPFYLGELLKWWR